MPGTYDPETNSVWWGTANPAPLYDWAGPDWKTSGPRPGNNLYTTSVIALDPETGALEPIYSVHYNRHAAHAMGAFDTADQVWNAVRSGCPARTRSRVDSFISSPSL